MDAKIFAMIDDLARPALLDLAGNPIDADKITDDYLRSYIRQQYESGAFSADDIIQAWED